MKLIFIYGPPAAGKLTVAERLSKLTGIALFHNHLSRDIVADIYGDKLDDNYDLVEEIRFKVFEYCAKNGTDLIFTVVYMGENDEAAIKEYIQRIKAAGFKINFVELTASPEDLVDRVDNDSRKKFRKLTDKSIMKGLTKDMDAFSIPFVDPLKINTSEVSSDDAAKLIAAEFDLP